MAANLQQMGAGQILPQQQQQLRRGQQAFNNQQITQTVIQQLMSQPTPSTGWQAGVNLADRMGKVVQL